MQQRINATLDYRGPDRGPDLDIAFLTGLQLLAGRQAVAGKWVLQFESSPGVSCSFANR